MDAVHVLSVRLNGPRERALVWGGGGSLTCVPAIFSAATSLFHRVRVRGSLVFRHFLRTATAVPWRHVSSVE